MAKNFIWLECDSYLGSNPICDICKKSVTVGDKVRQEFVGTVAFDNHELGIVEEKYTLVHVTCEQKIVEN